MPKLPIPFGNPHTYPDHSGVDYPVPRGTIFRASGAGTVRTLARNARGGFYIYVQYDGGPLVGYHHMDSHRGCPAVGTRVAEGTQLGYVGSLGQFSTGPHLHSEVAGHTTTAGYWEFFTPDRVVGQGNPSGGGSTPQPSPDPAPAASAPHEKDTMFQIKLIDNEGRFGAPGLTYYALIGPNYFYLDGPYMSDGESKLANSLSVQFGVASPPVTYDQWNRLILSTQREAVWQEYLKSVGKL